MTAKELFEVTRGALAVAGRPFWPAADAPGELDALVFFEAGQVEDGPLWALAPAAEDELGEVRVPDAEAVDAEELIPVPVGLADELIRSHLRGWLLDRGWQVQVRVSKQEQVWRLADCLSIADGGGDRLDDEYPYGEDELTVLCRSVAVVQESIAVPFRRVH